MHSFRVQNIKGDLSLSNSPALIISIIIIALLLFLGMCELLYLDITGLGLRKALHEFPAAAKELGFIQEKDRSSRPFGTYAGIYNGYNFTIDPDSNATVQLHMNPVPGVEEFSTRQGQTNFDSGDKGFDNFFKTRLVSAELGQKLREAVAFLAYTVEFGKRWKGKYNYIRMYKDSIYCSFKYGSGHYIPASVLEKIIPDLVKLADLLQAAVAEKK